MKYVRYEAIDGAGVGRHQTEVSDDLAAVWAKNGNTDISDKPWPDLPFVQGYIVVDGSAKATK